MMKSLRVFLPVMLFAVCGVAQDVRFNFAAGEDFSKFRTFKWVSIKNGQEINQLAEGQLKAAVNAELAKKGLQPTESDTADLYIGYQAGVGTEKQYTSFNNDWGYGPGWGGRWYGGGMGSSMTTGETSTIYIGQIGLDMYDPVAKKLVGRGTASKTLDAKAKPEKQQKNLQKAMAKLLKNYPPKPKS